MKISLAHQSNTTDIVEDKTGFERDEIIDRNNAFKEKEIEDLLKYEELEKELIKTYSLNCFEKHITKMKIAGKELIEFEDAEIKLEDNNTISINDKTSEIAFEKLDPTKNNGYEYGLNYYYGTEGDIKSLANKLYRLAV